MDKKIILKNGMEIQYKKELVSKLKLQLEKEDITDKDIINFFRDAMGNALDKHYCLIE